MNEKKIEAGSEQVYMVARALLEDFEAAKEKVIFRLTKKIEDPRILESYPNRPFLDMQIVYYLWLGPYTDGRIAMLKLSKEHMENWSLQETDLYALAEVNTPKLFPAVSVPIQEMLLQCLEELGDAACLESIRGEIESMPSKIEMQIASNCNRGYGANVILYPGFLKQQAEKLGGDLVVIPSSVHEMLLIPEGQGEMDASELNRMVQFVNATEVPEEDVLATRAYIYRADTDRIEIMATQMEAGEASA